MRRAIGLIIIVSLVAGAPLALTGCADTAIAVAEEENLTTLNFSVTGMHCQGCVASVRNVIAKIDGVQSCEVSLEEESATVKATDAEVAQRIIDAVSELDYTIQQQP